MATEELIKRFKAVMDAKTSLSEKKVRIEERHKTSREQLETLVKEITAKGYDPKRLAETLEEKTTALTKMLAEKESGMKVAAEKLQALEV
jgi:translation initiation factor 1 (eIF-1/SUI1)